MTAVSPPADHLLPGKVEPSGEVGHWGMVLLCCTEGALFAMLLGSYLFLGTSNPAWPPAGVEKPKLVFPPIMTLLLVSSSAAVYWGERGIKQGDRARLCLGLASGILLGAGFLTFQALEYAEKLRTMLPHDNAYAAIFYTITGFHGTHVFVGLLVLGYTLIRSLLGHFDEDRHLGVKNAALYWHFVDGVWIVIFLTLYISPRLY